VLSNGAYTEKYLMSLSPWNIIMIDNLLGEILKPNKE